MNNKSYKIYRVWAQRYHPERKYFKLSDITYIVIKTTESDLALHTQQFYEYIRGYCADIEVSAENKNFHIEWTEYSKEALS